MALVLALGACGEELGPCDEAAAQQLVYGRGGLVATKGQALVHDSCGNGVFCHSRDAKRDERFGAPAGLDLDMLPASSGWASVAEHRDEIWAEVREGSMPPKGVGRDTQGDGDWAFDVERAEGGTRLPAITTREGKAVVRNWLACGAPVVGETQVPSWAQPPSDAGTGALGYDELFEQVLAPTCATAGCHNAAAAGGLAMVDACAAYEALLSAGACGEARVTPGDGDSLLLDKVESAMPRCGGRMPPLGPLSQASVDAIRAWIEAGAEAEQCR